MLNFGLSKVIFVGFCFLFVAGCWNSSSSDGAGKGNGNGNGNDVGGGGDVILAIPSGIWTVSSVSCNGVEITSSYISTGVTMTYEFTPTQMIQTRTAAGCSQTAAVNFTFANSSFHIASGTEVTLTCNPTPCSGSGLSPTSICGIKGSTSSDSVLQVKSKVTSLIVTADDSQAESTCVSFGRVGPLQIVMDK